MEPKHLHKLTDEITKQLVDRGLLIEAGFAGFKSIVYPTAPQEQIAEVRDAFFGGAMHLYASIMSTMEEDREPTETDLARMEKIDTELKRFEREFRIRHGID